MRSVPIASPALVAAMLQMDMALGHAAPERFDPAPGAVLDEAPARVDGWFTQDIRRQEGELVVTFSEPGTLFYRCDYHPIGSFGNLEVTAP